MAPNVYSATERFQQWRLRLWNELVRCLPWFNVSFLRPESSDLPMITAEVDQRTTEDQRNILVMAIRPVATMFERQGSRSQMQLPILTASTCSFFLHALFGQDDLHFTWKIFALFSRTLNVYGNCASMDRRSVRIISGVDETHI